MYDSPMVSHGDFVPRGNTKRRCLLVWQAPRARKLARACPARCVRQACASLSLGLSHTSHLQCTCRAIKYNTLHNTTSPFPLATQQPHPLPPLTTTNTQSITTATNTTQQQQQQQQNTTTTQNRNTNKKWSNNSPRILNFNLWFWRSRKILNVI